MSNAQYLEKATFGAGCFWCVEAVFQQLKGVEGVVSGYAGGEIDNPTYEEVCSGKSGHAEVCQITFDPKLIPYEELLEVFWKTHDPTTLNRQGNDIGTQYRSVIYFHNEEQKKLAEVYKKQLEDSKFFSQPIVTEIAPLRTFFPAENYHQNYFQYNSHQPYCTIVIEPKLEKFRKAFPKLIKD
ncbi:peptide-methionine (S)-S-oxide reductase MsrA [Xanthovirga aplysinae]|uniref:peptide-methionine (S)-S-oxide reductase MsrA n=1 Tax=Xanthovirga aplysinae TaxID=2529853 RepID=UPI0012BD255E|nr:peptide-methionine (S)-S-oxide reductase MsrA [Xanthovirga aplysinae]MTI33189.1 peptide-methionine (S)-S-oxide reductase [Xanthovirga aplysinae]